MRAGLASLVAAVALAGCNVFGESGETIFAANESNRDIVIRVVGARDSWMLIPAETKGAILISTPRPGDSVVVFDRDCLLLGIVPLSSEVNSLRITTHGMLESSDDAHPTTGPDVARVGNYEDWFERDSWCVEELEQVSPVPRDL